MNKKKVFELKKSDSSMFAIATVNKVGKEKHVFLTYMYVSDGSVRCFEGKYNNCKEYIDELSDQCKKWCDSNNYKLISY